MPVAAATSRVTAASDTGGSGVAAWEDEFDDGGLDEVLPVLQAAKGTHKMIKHTAGAERRKKRAGIRAMRCESFQAARS
jgi:hypothetical protein